MADLPPISNCYLIREDNLYDRVSFVHIPETIPDSNAADYAEQQLYGRSEPVRAYSATGARSLSLSLIFVNHEEGKAKEEVFDRVNWLKHTIYPEYEADLVLPPPVLILLLGSFVRMRCIAKSVDVQWGAPYVPGTMYPMQAEVSISLEEVNPDPVSGSEILVGGVR